MLLPQLHKEVINEWTDYTYRSDDILHDVQITADKKSVP